MRKLLPYFLVLSFVAVSLILWAEDEVVEEIIARVNNQIITRSEYEHSKDELKKEAQQQDPANADKMVAERDKDVLRDLIDQEFLLEKGKDLGITADTEVIKKLDDMRKDMKLDSMEELEKAASPGRLLRGFQAEHAQPDHYPAGDRERSWLKADHQERR